MRSALLTATVFVTALLVAPVRAQQPPDAETAAAMRQLVEKTGSLETYNRMLDLMIDQLAGSLKDANPQRSQQEIGTILRDVLLPELKAIGPAMMELSVASYAKRFSVDEVREISAFYDTPVGQKLLREMPGLMQELMQSAGLIAQQTALRAFEKHRDTLRQRGVQIPL